MKKRGGKKRETKPGRRERTFNQIDKQLNDWENAGIQLLLTVRYEYFLMLFIVGQLVRRKGLGLMFQSQDRQLNLWFHPDWSDDLRITKENGLATIQMTINTDTQAGFELKLSDRSGKTREEILSNLAVTRTEKIQ